MVEDEITLNGHQKRVRDALFDCQQRIFFFFLESHNNEIMKSASSLAEAASTVGRAGAPCQKSNAAARGPTLMSSAHEPGVFKPDQDIRIILTCRGSVKREFNYVILRHATFELLNFESPVTFLASPTLTHTSI